MSTQVNRRRGTTVQHSTFTGAIGETTYDLTLKCPVVHDGVTAGGFPAAMLHLANIFSATQTISKQSADNTTNGLDFSKRGTVGDATAAVVSGVALGIVTFRGWDTATLASGGNLRLVTTEAWSPAAHGSQLLFQVTTAGTASPATAMTLNSFGPSFPPYGVAAGNTSELRLLELAANGTNYTGFKAPDSMVASEIYVLPTAAPSANRFLRAGAVAGGVSALSWTQIDLTADVTGVLPVANGGSGTGTAFTQGSVIFAGPAGVLAQDNAKLFFNDTSDFLGVGYNVPASELMVASISAADPRGIMSAQYSADTVGARLHLRKSRGAAAGTNTAIVIGDVLGRIQFSGYSGTSYIQTAGIRAVSTGTLAATRLASSLIFSTGTDAAPTVLTDIFKFDNTGQGYALVGIYGQEFATFRTAATAFAGTLTNRSVNIGNTGLITIASIGAFGFSANDGIGTDGGATPDTTLRRDAAATLALRNVASAETFRVYETADAFPGLTNYSRLSFQTQAGNHLIRTEAAGTGTLRILQVGTGPSTGANIAGIASISHGGQSTGSAAGGAHLIQVSLAGGAGSGVNALATVVTVAAVGTGDVKFATAATLSIASGTNQRAGNAVLVGGTITVANTTVTANTIVMLTRKTSGGTIGTAITYTTIAATSFTITSDSVLDTSTFSYMLIEVP